jgi:hypothetical protein
VEPLPSIGPQALGSPQLCAGSAWPATCGFGRPSAHGLRLARTRPQRHGLDIEPPCALARPGLAQGCSASTTARALGSLPGTCRHLVHLSALTHLMRGDFHRRETCRSDRVPLASPELPGLRRLGDLPPAMLDFTPASLTALTSWLCPGRRTVTWTTAPCRGPHGARPASADLTLLQPTRCDEFGLSQACHLPLLSPACLCMLGTCGLAALLNPGQAGSGSSNFWNSML